MVLRSASPSAPDAVIGTPTERQSVSDVRVGCARVVQAIRSVEGERGVARLEPLVLNILLVLAERPGALVDRQYLRDRCWDGAPVGDDSINRAVAGARRGLAAATASARIDTVPGSGYTLRAASETLAAAVAPPAGTATEAGWRSWRLALPVPDTAVLSALRQRVAERPDDAEAWSVLALVARHAAEYAEPRDCTAFVEECQTTARRALALEPSSSVAKAALIALPPLFGDWGLRRDQLLAALRDAPQDEVLRHELAFLEMATGRPSAAVPLIEALIAQDPLAAIYQYKRVYHLWSLGEHRAMDQVADRALQLWPKHPAIWFARLWSLMFTGRAELARALVTDDTARPSIPGAALDVLHLTATAVIDDTQTSRATAIEANRMSAGQGAAQCIAAIIHLGGLGAVDDAFAVAAAYLLNDGRMIVPKHRTPSDPAVTDQYRRLTQMLFIPATTAMRRDPRFEAMCDAMGLADYWRHARVMPDFRRKEGSPPSG